MQNELIEMFAVPLTVSTYEKSIFQELKFIENLDYKDNIQGLTRISKDFFILNRPELADLKKFIEYQIKLYVKNIYGSDDEVVITQSWVNKAKKGDFHQNHTHSNSLISGVFYPLLDETLPPIMFKKFTREISLNTKEKNKFNSDIYKLNLSSKSLVLFPSNLTHGVPINKSNYLRYSLAFNTWPKGIIGNKDELSYTLEN